MKQPNSPAWASSTHGNQLNILSLFTTISKAFFILSVFVSIVGSSKAVAQLNSNIDSVLNTQLSQVIRSGNITKLETLLKQGANANTISNDYSALMAATLNGTAAEMKLLIKHGANVNYCNRDSISALWLAAPDYDKTLLLINNSANPQQRSREGNNVLVKLAAIPGSVKLMELLISKGCDVSKSGPYNDIMFNAASTDDTAILSLLIRNGISVNDTSFTGDYPVNAATNFRCFNTLKMLVENGANVNVSPKHGILPLISGVTPLMWAAVSNDKPSFYYLLQHGADSKAITPRGYTTLMFLAMSEADDPEMTQALIELGASPVAKAKDQTDALYYAGLKGNTKSVAILTKYITNK